MRDFVHVTKHQAVEVAIVKESNYRPDELNVGKCYLPHPTL